MLLKKVSDAAPSDVAASIDITRGVIKSGFG